LIPEDEKVGGRVLGLGHGLIITHEISVAAEAEQLTAALKSVGLRVPQLIADANMDPGSPSWLSKAVVSELLRDDFGTILMS